MVLKRGMFDFVLCTIALLSSLSLPSLVHAAIVVDATSTFAAGVGIGGSQTYNHIVGSGSDRLLVVGIAIGSNNPAAAIPTVTAVTYNGVAMQQLGPHSSLEGTGFTQDSVEQWYLAQAPSGNNPIVITLSGGSASASFMSSGTSFTGVNQTTPIRTSTGNDANGTADSSGSVTISSAPGDVILDVACQGTGISSSNQTTLALLNDNTGSSCNNIGTSMSPGAGSVTMTWNFSGSDLWEVFASSIEPAPARHTILKPPNNLGLVGYWNFDEGTSTIAHDFSGNKNTGTLTTSGTAIPAWTNAGKHGGALSFDDTTQGYVQVGGSKVYAPSTSPFTFSAWVNLKTFVNTTVPQIATLRTDTGNPLYILIGSPSLTSFTGIAVCNSVSDGDWTTGFHTNVDPTPLLGSWHHVAITYNGADATDNGNFNTYLDGVAQTETGTTGCITDPVGQETVIGGFNDGQHVWDGRLDDVRVYNRALGASEVANLYQSGAVQINTPTPTLQLGTTLGGGKGLVGHWTFDGPDVTDKVYDRSGQGNNGYFVGSATSSAKTIGKLGQALSLNGSTSYVNIPDSPALRLTAGGTISAWIKPTDFGGASKGRIVDKSDDTGASNGYSLVVNNADVSQGITLRSALNSPGAGGVDCQSNPNVISLGVWQHVVGVIAPTGVETVYVNGVDVSDNTSGCSSNNSVPPNVALPINIGARGGATDRNFHGSIDDVRIYNRALSAKEVATLYKLGTVIIKNK